MALIAIFHLLFVCFLPAATRSSDASGAPQLQFIDCSTADNYTATDAYAANLNQLLAALPTNTVSKNGGFFNTTVGQGAAATVYGLALCPVDFSRSDCNDCFTAASSSATGLVKRCPGSVTVSAIFDQCMLRYSNKKLSGIAETDIKFTLTGAMVATRQAYSDSLKQGLAYLSAEAATSPERFAASTTAPYALVQCTWDLPPDKCKACIDTLSANASDLFAVGIDGERKSYSCRVRYSNSSFTVVPLVVPTGHPSSSDKNTNKAVVAGAVIGTLIAVGSIIILFFFCVARKRRYERLPKGGEGPDLIALHFCPKTVGISIYRVKGSFIPQCKYHELIESIKKTTQHSDHRLFFLLELVLPQARLHAHKSTKVLVEGFGAGVSVNMDAQSCPECCSEGETASRRLCATPFLPHSHRSRTHYLALCSSVLGCFGSADSFVPSHPKN